MNGREGDGTSQSDERNEPHLVRHTAEQAGAKSVSYHEEGCHDPETWMTQPLPMLERRPTTALLMVLSLT
jgi:hypothetical protein